MPPAVEPEHPPIIIRTTKTACGSEGQRAKSSVAKPVVVKMDTVWKMLERTVLTTSSPGASIAISKETIVADAKSIKIKALNSVLVEIRRNRPFNVARMIGKLMAPRIMNTIPIISTEALPKAAMLSVRVLNPPVATVVNIWQTASNQLMPAKR